MELKEELTGVLCGLDDQELSGEQKLWVAVLLDAVAVYSLGTKEEKRIEKKWFTSTSDDPYSYLWICEQIRLDPDKLWGRRQSWRKILQQDKRIAPLFGKEERNEDNENQRSVSS